jgi:hypothetical protein
VLPHREKRVSRVDVVSEARFERQLRHGRRNGSKNASFEIRKASQSHARYARSATLFLTGRCRARVRADVFSTRLHVASNRLTDTTWA